MGFLIEDGVEGVEGELAEDAGVVEAAVLVEAGDGGELVGGEDEVEVEVFAEAVGRLGFGDGDGSALHGPADEDLGGGAGVGGGDLFDDGVIEETVGFFGHAEGEVGVGAEGGEGGDGDVLRLGVADEGVLAEVGVEFDLEGGGLDAGVAEEVAEALGGEIANADAFDEAVIDELFHGAPGIGVGHADGFHGGVFLGGVDPTGWVAFFEGDELEGDGEVDEVEVELVDAEVLEGALAGGADVLWLVVGVPEFGGDPEVVAFAKAGIEGGLDAFSDEVLIAVVAGAVEVSPAGLDGFVDDGGDAVFVDFPGAEAGRGEGGAIGEKVCGHEGRLKDEGPRMKA